MCTVPAMCAGGGVASEMLPPFKERNIERQVDNFREGFLGASSQTLTETECFHEGHFQ